MSLVITPPNTQNEEYMPSVINYDLYRLHSDDIKSIDCFISSILFTNA